MIKRIIFDLDNTLIPWKPEYTAAIKKAKPDYGQSSILSHMKIITINIQLLIFKNMPKNL